MPAACPTAPWPFLGSGGLARCALSVLVGYLAAGSAGIARAQALPDAPDTLIWHTVAGGTPSRLTDLPETLAAPQTTSPTQGSRCKPAPPGVGASASGAADGSCKVENPVQSVVSKPVRPLKPRSKALLALRDVDDPFNLITIAGYSGVAISSNAHSAFGPGLAGWGRLTGYSLVEDAQGEFTGTFLIPALAHEDPRYHRMPGAPFTRRVLHALAHTYVSQHDDGSRMPNYATLLNYPLGAELANLYVPGIQSNGPATAHRIGLGLLTDPSGTLVAEFLPDLARHIHIHILFVQEIVNQVITRDTVSNGQ